MAVIRDQEGRVSVLHGLPIQLEAYAGTYRTKPGKQPVLIASDYGEIVGTVGADGDPLDCYVGVFPEVLNIYVINQATAAGTFDEHKVMFGFLSQADAVMAYQLSTFNKEPLSVIPCTMAQFNWWLKFGNKKAEVTAQSFPFDPESEIAMQQNIFDWGQPKAAAGLAIYDMGRVDQAEELNEAVTYDDMMETILAEGGEFSPEVVMDALVIQQQMLSRKARQIGMALNRLAGGDIQVKEEGIQVSEPYKVNGTTNVAVIFEMTDGQTISVFMHNPDASPKTIKPTDNLIAWRWLLNRKDITIVVAKENGRDQQINIIARKVMALVEANAGRFLRANKRRTEREAALGEMQAQVEAKRAVLAAKLAEIEQLKAGVVPVEPSVDPVEPTEAPASVVDPEGLNPSNEGLNPVGARVPAPEVPKEGSGLNEGVKPMASGVVTLTGNELGHVDTGTNEGKQKLRTQAKALFEEMLGDWVDCPTLGGKVEIRKRGMKKVLSASHDPRKLKVVAGLKNLITAANKVKTVEPYNANEDPSAVAYHILQAPVQLGDEPLSVRIVVKEDHQGEFHYDHSVHPNQAVLDSAQEKSPTGVELNSVATSDDRGTDPSRIASHELDSSIAVLDAVVNNGLVLNLFFVDEAGVVLPDPVDEGAPALADDDPVTEGEQQPNGVVEEPGQAVTVEQPSAGEPVPENTKPDMEQDKAFLQSVIDDAVDVLADDFADKLLAVAEKYQGEEFPEMQTMVDAAATAYTNKLEQLTA